MNFEREFVSNFNPKYLGYYCTCYEVQTSSQEAALLLQCWKPYCSEMMNISSPKKMEFFSLENAFVKWKKKQQYVCVHNLHTYMH